MIIVYTPALSDQGIADPVGTIAADDVIAKLQNQIFALSASNHSLRERLTRVVAQNKTLRAKVELLAVIRASTDVVASSADLKASRAKLYESLAKQRP